MQQTRLRWGLTNTGSTSVTASLALLVCICSPAASLANQPLPPPELPEQPGTWVTP